MFVCKLLILVWGVGWVDKSFIGWLLLFVVFMFCYKFIDCFGLNLDFVISWRLMILVLDLWVWLKGSWILIWIFNLIVVMMGFDWGILFVVKIWFIVWLFIFINVDCDIFLLLCFVIIWFILWLMIVVSWCWFFVMLSKFV